MEHLSIKTLNVNQWIDAPVQTAKITHVTIVEKNMHSGAAGVWIEVTDSAGKKHMITTSAAIIKTLGKTIEATEQFWQNNPTGNLS